MNTPIRSFFIAPANRPDLVHKFPRFGADCNIIDLEDGTPQHAKAAARKALANMVGSLRQSPLNGLIAVRVNQPTSVEYLDDVRAAIDSAVDVIVVPKVESHEELFPIAHAISHHAKPVGIMLGIESMRGVANAESIIKACPFNQSLYFGAEDFITDIGGIRTEDSVESLYARSHVLLHARMAGLAAIDQGVADIRDDNKFRRDALTGRALGYSGKICLLPRQVAIAHEVFSPSADEITYARRLIQAYNEATSRGIGTIDFEGRMIDGPLLKRAESVLSAAKRWGLPG